jgi:uncharacterized protein YjbI with pentapeptide repeats
MFMTKKSFWAFVFTVLAITLMAFGIAQGYSVTWSGFTGKTIWDWLDLLVVPIVLGVGAYLLNRSERESDRQRAEAHAKVEREISLDRQREVTFQSYIDHMEGLLLNEKLRTTKNKEIQNIARTRTLSVLRMLDGNRKYLLFRFLLESRLVGVENPVIELQGADLSDTDLSNINLSGVNFILANLNGANLTLSNLRDADISGADLIKANLTVANLSNVNFSGADLTGANLNQANLSSANFSAANLTNANLKGANLSFSNLTGAEITKKQLEETKSLKGVTMPDGTKHD